jgi:polyhydroxyalkanoate synthase
MTAARVDDASIGARIRAEVDRAIQRNIKGVEFFASPGPRPGLTPRDLVHSRGTLGLWHYRPMAEEIYRVPILIVMATTNRGYILDLAPGQSMVEFLLKRGYDVYLIDWNPPRADERHLRIDDYVLDFIPDCVRRVQQRSGEPDVSVIGYCMGGVLSTIYAALHPEGPLRNLVLFTTPIDWRHMNLFHAWSDRRYFDVDRLVDSLGNVPPEVILSAFDMLRPASRVAGQARLWEAMWNDEFVKAFRMLDRWGNEILPLAGEYFRQTIKELMWENRLHEGRLVIRGKPATLSSITVPVLHVVAEHDHIVPRDASKPLIEGVASTDREEVVLKGGHVSLVAGPSAIGRMWPKLDSWLAGRSL